MERGLPGSNGPSHFEAELPGELHVVAHLRMQIQRQVVSEQTDIVVQQGLQAPLLHADHAGILTLPEVAVMHQHHVGVGLHGSIQQRLAGSDPLTIRRTCGRPSTCRPFGQ